MSRRNADIWKQLVDEAGEDEIERAASVSVAQAGKELAAAGFDVRAERAKANAFLDDLEQPTRVSPSRSVHSTPSSSSQARRGTGGGVYSRPVAAWVAVATGTGVVLYAAMGPIPGPIAPAPPGSSQSNEAATPDPRSAADLRRQAAAECDARKWGPCLADLDQARALDPAGDDAPEIKRLRARALEQQSEPPDAHGSH